MKNVYRYTLKEGLVKSTKLIVGAKVITTDVEMINSLCEQLYPKDIVTTIEDIYQ